LEQKALTFLKNLEKDRIPSPVLIHGQEEYLVRAILDKLREKMGWSVKVLWGEDADSEALFSEIFEGDMFSATARRAVFLMNFDSFLKKISRSKKKVEEISNRLMQIKDPVFIAHYPSRLKPQDLKKKPFSAFAQRGAVVTADRVPAGKVKEIVKRKFEREAGGIDDDALELLVSLTGGDLMILKQETEKLITYSGGERITLEMVSKVSTPWSRSGVFDLVDNLFLGRTEDYLVSLRNLLREGVQPIQLMALISGYAVKLYLILYLLRRGITEEEALKRAGIQGGFQEYKFKGYIKSLTFEEVRDLLYRLYEADRNVKTFFVDPVRVLEDLAVSRVRS